MPDIAICPQCENAHWADKPHSCGAEHDRLEAQAKAIKARQETEKVVELVQRCSQLKWLAACILAKGPNLPSRQQWASLYHLAEGAEPLARETLAKYPLALRELEKQEHRYRTGR